MINTISIDETLTEYLASKILEKKIEQTSKFAETRELLNKRDKDELVSTVLALYAIIVELERVKIQPMVKE